MSAPPHITRRTLLAAGAGSFAGLAVGGLPAWARPRVRHHGHRVLRVPGSRPFPHLKTGTPGAPHEVDRVVVVMLENHSFDNILGQLVRPGGVDGLTAHGGRPGAFNLDATGRRVGVFHLPDDCPSTGLSQAWNASHAQFNGGRNDGFVRTAQSTTPMGYFGPSDLPVTYDLAMRFPINQRFFCSTLAQTYPNRRFLFTGTASGTISTDNTTFDTHAPNGTVFDRLDSAHLDWRVYFSDVASPLIVPEFNQKPADQARCVPYASFLADARAGRLPHVSFVEPNFGQSSEENPQDVTYGERFLWSVTSALFASPQWPRTAMFVTYDEHGGFFDHVPPPAAIRPDSTGPMLRPGDVPGDYDRYGFRVPLILVSPWARRRHVSNVVSDHTSILSFIQHKWNLPAMTYRDANAAPMLDLFDTSRAHFRIPPPLPAPPSIDLSLARCRADGRTPPADPAKDPVAES